MTRRRNRKAGIATAPLAAIVTGLVLGGCGDPIAPSYHIAATGYVERGGALTLALLDRAAPVPPTEVAWTATPATAVTLRPGPVAQLIDTGAATIEARIGARVVVLPLHIAVPPTILFDLQDSAGAGNRDIYRATLDGRSVTRLTSDTADNEQPTASASVVIFTSYRSGQAALYAVSPSGGTETLLSAAPAPASQPALSSDGRKLAFISPSGGFDHLWTSAADGSGATRVTGSVAFNNALQATPSWAPGADTVVAMSTQFGNAALVRVTLAADSEVALTNGGATDLSPAWSPDGQSIAFASTRDGDLGIFLLEVSSGAVTRVTPAPGADGEPAWLRDGRLVYTSDIGTATQLRWVDPSRADSGHLIPTPAGGNPHHPTAFPLPPS